MPKANINVSVLTNKIDSKNVDQSKQFIYADLTNSWFPYRFETKVILYHAS